MQQPAAARWILTILFLGTMARGKTYPSLAHVHDVFDAATGIRGLLGALVLWWFSKNAFSKFASNEVECPVRKSSFSLHQSQLLRFLYLLHDAKQCAV